MGVNTPCMTYSESGQPTGGGPCAEFEALKLERDALFSQAAEDSVVICRLKRIIARERQERDALRSSLCLYQLQHWTMKYHLERWFDPLVGDDSKGCAG